jgi:peptidoglycan/LPS O-acetylase OafA/YrhL
MDRAIERVAGPVAATDLVEHARRVGDDAERARRTVGDETEQARRTVGDEARPAATDGDGARSRYLDALRALAILRVYLLHTLWLGWLPAVFPAMWVMFAIGGYLTAVALHRGSAPRMIRSRLRRLLPPLWVLAILAVPLMLVHDWRPGPLELVWWVLPLANPPASEWGGPFAMTLWYLRAYLWLVLLSPALWWAFRRWPVVVLISLPTAAALCYSPLVVVPDNPVGDVLRSTVSYGTCWLLGFARHTRLLDQIPLPGYAALVAATASGSLLWIGLHSAPIAELLWGTAFVLVLMRARPGIGWLDRMPWLAGAVVAVNARAVTIYVWHLPAAYAVVAFLPAVGGGGWAGTLAATTALLAGIVVAVGWVEDLAARRRPRLLPPTRRRDGAAAAGGGRSPAPR